VGKFACLIVFSRLEKQKQMRKKNSRLFSYRILGLRVAATLLLTPVLCAPLSAQEVKLRIGYFPNITHVQALVARAFERTRPEWLREKLGPNIKLEWYSYNAGPSAMEAVFAGSIDLSYVGPNPALNAYTRSRGQEARVIAGAMNGGAALVVQSDSTLKTPTDFRGKRIATPQFGNTQDVSARAWLVKGGLKITQTGGDAQVIPTANPDQLSLFKSKQLDGVWTVEPWVSRLELEAQGKVLLEERDAIITILVARAKFLAEHRELAAKFAGIHRALTDWIKANPDETQALVRDQLKIELRAEFPAELVRRAWPRLTPTNETSLEAFNKVVQAAQSVGFLKDTPDLGKLVVQP
jgi:NitT/TauT family transport system substrate-binding protein